MRPLPEGKVVKKCRICGGELTQVLDLGFHPPSDRFLTKEQLDEPEVTYPLRLCYCQTCTLAQLDYIVPKETLFCEDYPYETGVNEGGIKHFRDFADEVIKKYVPNLTATADFIDFGKMLIVDIGGNDGTFLQRFAEFGFNTLNVDPCGVKSKVPVWKDFWSAGHAEAIKTQHGQADIITATNVLAHTEDLHDFMEGVNILLKDDGVLVIETPSLDAMINGLQFDQIYHEHLGYFSIEAINILIKKYGFGIAFYQSNEMHGGSLRLYIKRYNGNHVFYKKNYLPRLKEFAENVASLRIAIKKSIYNHGVVLGIAASAKGNTLLNFCGITNKDLAVITDKSKLKQGKYTPGSHIPIVGDDRLPELDEDDCALMLACNFKKNIVKAVKELGYKGRFMIPYPKVSIE